MHNWSICSSFVGYAHIDIYIFIIVYLSFYLLIYLSIYFFLLLYTDILFKEVCFSFCTYVVLVVSWLLRSSTPSWMPCEGRIAGLPAASLRESEGAWQCLMCVAGWRQLADLTVATVGETCSEDPWQFIRILGFHHL